MLWGKFFMNMKKHEIKIIKSVFINKTVYTWSEVLLRCKRIFVRLFPWNLPLLNLNDVSKWKDTRQQGFYPFYFNSNYYLQTR